MPGESQPRERFIAQIYRLALVAQTLLVAVEFHPLLALVLGDFRFASFLQGTHRDWFLVVALVVEMTRAVERSIAPVRKQTENQLFCRGFRRV